MFTKIISLIYLICMAVNEINDVIPQNYKTKPIMPDNLSRSDELDIGENNVLKGESYYARNKRIAKTNRIVLLTLSITAMFTGGGVFTSNALLGEAPIINNFDTFYTIEGNEFSYTLDVTVDKTRLLMDIVSTEVIYELKMDVTGVYSGSLNLESGEYTVKFISTNYFDYKQVIKNYLVTFTI